jgi:hypothetical protein
MPQESLNKLADRFWAKVNIVAGGECWTWTRSRSRGGYGKFNARINGKRVHTASRIAWIICHGIIPGRLHVLHRCDNPPCVRPDHLFLGTNLDNVRDSIAKGRRARPEQCVNGHQFSKSNTYIIPATGRRNCKQCRRNAVRRYRQG